MTKAVVVRYQTRADTAERNQRLIEQVFAAFQDGAPGRQAGPPVVSEATLVGSYRFAEE